MKSFSLFAKPHHEMFLNVKMDTSHFVNNVDIAQISLLYLHSILKKVIVISVQKDFLFSAGKGKYAF